jgi:mannonate dehydratase
MNRRNFIASTAAALTIPLPAQSKLGKPRLGCQSAPSNEKHFQYFARYGVRDICGYPEITGESGGALRLDGADGRLYATKEELQRLRDLAEKCGLNLESIAAPLLTSSHIDKEKHPAIMLANSPERDRDIEALQTLIRNCAAVGIPQIKYNMSILGVLRTGRAPGRGDSTYSQWQLRDAHPNPPLTRAGRVTADAAWERISYFLERIIPVANETRSAWPAIPTTPACRPRATRASRACWEPSMA